jgi:hypothetical protein
MPELHLRPDGLAQPSLLDKHNFPVPLLTYYY